MARKRRDAWRDRPTVTITEAAEILGIGVSTAYRAARAGTMPRVRIGGRWVVPSAALERILELDEAAS